MRPTDYHQDNTMHHEYAGDIHMKNTLQVHSQVQTTNSQPWAVPSVFVVRPSQINGFHTLAAEFDPISLKEMDAVALLNRVDTKFVMSTGQLLAAVSEVRSNYWILEVNGQRLNHYRTLYFDTPDFQFFHDHVNGNAERYKVRSREYIDSQSSFLEVKHKTRKNRTIKNRIPTQKQIIRITPESNNWLSGIMPVDGNDLEPKLWNAFTRLTLVSKQFNERVTLDIDLMVYAADRVARLTGLAIAEVKMAMGNGDTPFLQQMRSRRIHAQGFSKYSIGVAMLYEQVKKNALKPKMMRINKLMEGIIKNERPDEFSY